MEAESGKWRSRKQDRQLTNVGKAVLHIVLSRSQVSSHLLDIYKSCWLDCGPSQRYVVKLKRWMVSQPVASILPDNVGWAHNQANKTCKYLVDVN